MKRVATALIPFLFAAIAAGQQTGLTDAQQKSAEAEVPRLMQILELKPGMTIADVGAGFGAWTTRFSRALGPKGHVFANDIGAQQLTFLREWVKKEGLTNVTVVEGAPGNTNLPNLCCDAILIRDAYHHLTQPDDIIRSFAAALKPGGRILECTPWKREKTYLFKRNPEWDIHLPPSQEMADAMRACGMRPVADAKRGLWERVPG